MGERGQTTQDFAIGVSVLLVTIIGAFVFSQGGALSVYEGTDPGVKQPQADRIASHIVENYSVEGQANVLRYDNPGGGDLDDLPSGELSELKLQAGVNVSSDRRADPIVNVSIVNTSVLNEGERTPARDGGSTLAWGESRRSEAVTASRVVRLENDDTSQCTPDCWLVVRVW